MNDEEPNTFSFGAIGGAFDVRATSIKHANEIFQAALNSHPNIYCDWVDLEGVLPSWQSRTHYKQEEL